jgi:CheY-like chemotaxis protein
MTVSKHVLVLLVEDEPIVRMIASDSLEEAGFDVVEASNAQEAMAILAARDDVGVLFTDVDMPGKLDGLALAGLVHTR